MLGVVYTDNIDFTDKTLSAQTWKTWINYSMLIKSNLGTFDEKSITEEIVDIEYRLMKQDQEWFDGQDIDEFVSC